MSDMFSYYLQKYLEKLTNLESHLLALRDESDLLEGITNIKLFLQPYKVIHIEENVIFRSMYENIKEEKNINYILVFKRDEIQKKLLDFIKRSEEGKVKEISMSSLLECVEEDIKWNEYINEFSSEDIKKKFKELIFYRKLIRKNSIEKHEISRVFLSSLLELDAVHLKDEVDCYLYYRDIRDIYGGFENLKYKTDIKQLVLRVFENYGSLLTNVIGLDVFEEFELLLWVCCGLESLGRLNEENVKYVLENKYNKLETLNSYFNKLVDFSYIIGKKDKKYFIQKKDWAEKLILNSKIDIISSEHSYKEILREGKGSLINIIESIRAVLKDYNVEGFKKVFKYNIDNLYELAVLINESVNYKTDNIKELINIYDLIVNLFKKVEYAENQIRYVDNLNSYTEWESFYKNHLYDLQYRLSEVRYLDGQDIIEGHRYALVNKRISNILNKYRESFAFMLKTNYSSWKQNPYGISRPILNSDISSILNLNTAKTYIIIFDGMRYDAWEYIVRPYFENLFAGRNTKYRDSFALLPSITSISRTAIYSNILNEYKGDTAFCTKSESIQNENNIKETILQDKKINIFVFNMFDKDGHKATEDFYIFYEKQKKVFEKGISELLNMITDDSNIVIASDHGLMRIDDYINMKDVADIADIKPRYIKSGGNIGIEGLVTIDEDTLLSFDNKGYFIGGGEKSIYSHGGASIEEVIVPFIVSESKVSKSNLSIEEKYASKAIETEVLHLDDDKKILLKFKLNEKEKIILLSLYSFKNQNISNRDIEKILINKVGSAGMVGAIIGRLIKKLKKDGLDLIEESAVGDLIMYKFKHDRLEGDN